MADCTISSYVKTSCTISSYVKPCIVFDLYIDVFTSVSHKTYTDTSSEYELPEDKKGYNNSHCLIILIYKTGGSVQQGD